MAQTSDESETSNLDQSTLATAQQNSIKAEAGQVARLQRLLQDYYAAEETSRQTLPTESELEARQSSQQQVAEVSRVPFSATKVLLTGAQGSTALAQITLRLSSPEIPESRRSIEALFSIKTRLFGTLITSERRSLKPVGKNHYVTKLHLQPGKTEIRMQRHTWEFSLPNDNPSSEYLVTLYKPPGLDPELHVFSVDQLLMLKKSHVPAWLPQELGIARTG